MSSTHSNPFDREEWKALHRECRLILQLIGAGVTSIGKADFANGLGNYYMAFFGISLGIERLCKLILVADHAVNTKGKLLSPETLRKEYGHEINTLIDKVSSLDNVKHINIAYPQPMDEFSKAIIKSLTSFSDAKKGRYANFQALDYSNYNHQFEPLTDWWSNIAELILQNHFYGKPAENRANQESEISASMYGNMSKVIHFNEIGQPIDNLFSFFLHSKKNIIVQRYSRFYILRIVRWLATVFTELTSINGQEIDVLFGHYEIFAQFLLKDKYLKSSKIWPIKDFS